MKISKKKVEIGGVLFCYLSLKVDFFDFFIIEEQIKKNHPIVAHRWVEIFLCLNSPKYSQNNVLSACIHIFRVAFVILNDN